METTGKLSIQCDHFEDHIKTAFSKLRENEDYVDVTLACAEDQVQAHKVIVASFSPILAGILKRQKSNHPVIYLKGIKSVDLINVVNFMYEGQVSLAASNLDSFFDVANELQVEGLFHRDEVEINTEMDESPLEPANANVMDRSDMDGTDEKAMVKVESEDCDIQTDNFDYGNEQDVGEVSDIQSDFLDNHIGVNVGGDYEAVWEPLNIINNLKMFMSAGNGKWRCNVCNKMIIGNKWQMKRHVIIHVPGQEVSCNICGTVFKNRYSFESHKSKTHGDLKKNLSKK